MFEKNAVHTGPDSTTLAWTPNAAMADSVRTVATTVWAAFARELHGNHASDA